MKTRPIKEWEDMTDAQRAHERSLPKDTRQLHAVLRGMARKPAAKGRLVKSRRGTWGRTLLDGCRKGCVAALTQRECKAQNLVPGPGNN